MEGRGEGGRRAYIAVYIGILNWYIDMPFRASAHRSPNPGPCEGAREASGSPVCHSGCRPCQSGTRLVYLLPIEEEEERGKAYRIEGGGGGCGVVMEYHSSYRYVGEEKPDSVSAKDGGESMGL